MMPSVVLIVKVQHANMNEYIITRYE